jgi:hypothetical protein
VKIPCVTGANTWEVAPRVAFSSMQSSHWNTLMLLQLSNPISISPMDNLMMVAFHTTYALMALQKLSIITQLRICVMLPVFTMPLRTLHGPSRATLWRLLKQTTYNIVGIQLLIPVAIAAVTYLGMIFLGIVPVALPHALFCLGAMFQILVIVGVSSFLVSRVRHVGGLATKQSTVICLQWPSAWNNT